MDNEAARDMMSALFYGYPDCEEILQHARHKVEGTGLSLAIHCEYDRWKAAQERVECACFINLMDQMRIDSINAVFHSMYHVELGLVAVTGDEYNEAKSRAIKFLSGRLVACLAAGCELGMDDLLRRLYAMSWAGVVTRRKVMKAVCHIRSRLEDDNMKKVFQHAVDARFHPACKTTISASSFPATNAEKSTPTRHSGPCMESAKAVCRDSR